MSEMANDSLLIKSAASERSDGSDVRQKEVCSYVWTSHTHREGTLDSAIRCYHGKHFWGLALPCGSPWRREEKKIGSFFFFAACSFFLLSQYATRSPRSKHHNGAVQSEGQRRRGAEETWSLGSQWWELKNNNKEAVFLKHFIIVSSQVKT